MARRKRVWGYWGYGVAALLVILWLSGDAANQSILLLVLSGIVTAYFMFGAPLWCGAVTRGSQLCRNNAHGVLFGCHLRQHKWQKVKLAAVPSQWRRLNAGLWTDPKTSLATIGAVLGIISIISSLVIQVANA